jgi:hypothetical protein
MRKKRTVAAMWIEMTAQVILFGFSGMVSREGIEPSTYGLARKLETL